jgi:uncharacterized protein with GYD domain
MPTYLVKGNYVGSGVAGLLNEGGSSRRDAASAAVASVGGTLREMHYAFGDTDVYALADFPDEASATACSLLINASGAVQITLTPLMTPEDLDAAAQKSPSYTPPGS